MKIPWRALDPDTLTRLIEQFVLMEGTEYGERDYSLEEKVAQVKTQLAQGKATIVWSELHQQAHIVMN